MSSCTNAFPQPAVLSDHSCTPRANLLLVPSVRVAATGSLCAHAGQAWGEELQIQRFFTVAVLQGLTVDLQSTSTARESWPSNEVSALLWL